MQIKQKILLVDDRDENLFALEKILLSTGAELIKASSGNDALSATLNHDFTLAIIDVNMPTMNGYELAELLRGDERTRHLPIIFVSAVYSDEHHVFKAYEAGAVDFITKPFNVDILRSKVRVFLELDRQRLERAEHLARLNALVRISTEILSAKSTEDLFKRVTDAARKLTGALIGASGHGYIDGAFRVLAISGSENVIHLQPESIFQPGRGGVYRDLMEKGGSVRLTNDELLNHPGWWGLPEGHAPLKGLLGATLLDRQGKPNAVIMLSNKEDGDFTEEDEVLLNQLAVMASLVLQHITFQEELRRTRDGLDLRVRERTAELDQRVRQLARLSSQLTLAEQRERRRLAVIIHDHLQQLLVGAKIHLEVLSRQLGEEHRKTYETVYNLLIDSIKTSRSLSTQMAPFILYERGLAPGLDWLAQTMRETYQLGLETQIGSDIKVDREDVKVLLFESVRELLFNVVKHARSLSARIEMRLDKGSNLHIAVSDQGVGFDPDKLKESGPGNRFGLFSIRERMELIGGELKIESTPGKGSSFSLIIPMDNLTKSSA